MKNVIIGQNILHKSKDYIDLEKYSKVAVLTDKIIGSLWLTDVKKSIGNKIITIIIEPGEKSKNIKTVEKIWNSMLQNGLDRHSLLINLGGGVIGDMGGFTASTYMRGIEFVQIPTTLLSQVDAATGGKTGINLNGVKNTIGTFTEPSMVIIDINTLKTLPDREFVAGFGEIIKHGIIVDRKYFEFVTSKKPREFSDRELIEIINGSVEIKSTIVEKDSKETGLRKILNFGHTLGHAFESVGLKSKSPLLHGEAISIGMVSESWLAVQLGILSEKEFKTIEESIVGAGLPAKINNISVGKVMEIIKADKKNRNGKVLFSLPVAIGRAKIDIEAPNELVEKAIEYITSENDKLQIHK